MNTFRAYRIHRIDGHITPRFDEVTLDNLTDRNVVVRVSYSDINYKDALAATGTAPILRKYPLAGGIDLAGEVVSSADPRYTSGPEDSRHGLRLERDAGRWLFGMYRCTGGLGKLHCRPASPNWRR